MNNLTAKISCFARAYHHRENKIQIFSDDKAFLLLGKEYDMIAQNMKQGVSFFLPEFKGTAEEGLRLIVNKQLSPSVLGRSAFCEEMLQSEKRLGCRQHVVFAAGYDTFGVRNDDESLSVYELDLPEVLVDKVEKIKEAGLEDCAVKVPCNLVESTWTQKLLEKGYNPGRKAFGSLLGISYYLNEQDFKLLIENIGKIMAEGSAICFDFPLREESREARINRTLAKGAGEEMKAAYSYGEIEKLLSECGFIIYEYLDDDAVTERFFSEYNLHNPECTVTAPKGVGYVLAVRKQY